MKADEQDRLVRLHRRRSTQTVLASIGAIGSVIAASSCCLPILPFLFAAGFAGSSAVLSTLRPYLLTASFLFVGYGFYETWLSKRCQCRPSLLSSLFLWTSAVVVVIAAFLPQGLADAVASLLVR